MFRKAHELARPTLGRADGLLPLGLIVGVVEKTAQ
jgi:hypothetical protein